MEGSTPTGRPAPFVGLDRTTAATLAGDVLVVVTVIVAGQVSHGGDPVGDPLATVATVAPFLAGWAAVALVLGTYGRDPASVPGSVRIATGTWLGAANVGLLLRGSDLFAGGIRWPFPLVVTGSVVVGLVAWRAVAAVAIGRTR